MVMNEQELEVKFYVSELNELQKRLESIGAQVVQPRTHEVNLRFDTPDRDLTRTYQVLRLRHDTAIRLTYKGPSQVKGGVRARKEIEFVVSDFKAAQDLLEVLGYQVSMMYEKFRTEYILDGVYITLDEMPYGDFTEIEGPDPQSIQAINQRLGLDWDKRILESYNLLFERLRSILGFEFRDLSFANFEGLEINFSTIDIVPADAKIE
jgi:adenylate cyclase class 2